MRRSLMAGWIGGDSLSALYLAELRALSAWTDHLADCYPSRLSALT